MSKTTNVILAAAAGFIAGILLAPKSGKETRQQLKDKAQDAQGRANDKAEQVKGAAALLVRLSVKVPVRSRMKPLNLLRVLVAPHKQLVTKPQI